MGLRAKAHPVLYEINTRVLLRELSLAAGKAVTLGTIPGALLEAAEEQVSPPSAPDPAEEAEVVALLRRRRRQERSLRRRR